MSGVQGARGSAAGGGEGAGKGGGGGVNLAKIARYGLDSDPRDHADTPELRRLFQLYDANLEAGACGTCAMDLAMVQHAKEFGRDYDPGKRQCAKRPPRPAECDAKVAGAHPQ